MTDVVRLNRSDCAAMSALHTSAFPLEEAWTATDMAEILALPTTRARGIMRDEGLAALAIVQCVGAEAEILTLATTRAQQRQGLARQLLDSIETELMPIGLKKWLLDVAADNFVALSFYHRLGFGEDGRRPNYYKRLEGQRIDAILMSKSVGGQEHG